MIQINNKAPSFALANSANQIIKLEDFKGKKVILYFYPKDDTPGCTLEAQDFDRLKPEFDKLNTIVFGISKDSVKSHDDFKCKYNLSLELLSDDNGIVCEQYGVIVEKSMFNKSYLGIERTTFLINENGAVEYIWPKVVAANHAEAVLNYLKR